MGTGKELITPTEPEAQAYRLWWMFGLYKVIYRQFCLIKRRRRGKVGGKERGRVVAKGREGKC